MNRPFWSHRRTSHAACESIKPLLPLYADGMATPGEVRLVEAHLPACADCRAALLWIQATHSALASRPVAVPPPDLHSRIAQAIAASSAAPGTLAAPLRPTRSFTLRPAYAVAASVTMLGLAFGLSHTLRHAPVQPAPHSLTASTLPPAGLPHALSSAAHPFVKHSKSAPLVASVGPKPETRPLPPTRIAPPSAMTPHEHSALPEVISPLETTGPQEKVAKNAPVPLPVPIVHVKAPAPTVVHDKVALVKTPPAENRLPVIVPGAAPKTPAPKMPDAPQIAMQNNEIPSVPVLVQPPVVKTEPPVRTASASHSDDLLGAVNAAAKAMRTAAYAPTELTRRRVYGSAVSAVQSLDSSHVPVYNAIYSGTSAK